jgi:hypothetical protein
VGADRGKRALAQRTEDRLPQAMVGDVVELPRIAR